MNSNRSLFNSTLPALHMELKYHVGMLCQLLSALPETEYTKPLDLLGGNTIGKHMRHILEVIQALETGYPAGVVNYDRRPRNETYEMSPSLTSDKLLLTTETLSQYKNKDLNLTTMDACNTSFIREMRYLLDHTVHHMAIVAIAVRFYITNIDLPYDFGVSGSTLQYQSEHSN